MASEKKQRTDQRTDSSISIVTTTGLRSAGSASNASPKLQAARASSSRSGSPPTLSTDRPTAATVGRLGKIAKMREMQVPGEFNWIVIVTAVLSYSIDFFRCKSRIFNGGANSFACETHFASSRILGILGMPDSYQTRLVT